MGIAVLGPLLVATTLVAACEGNLRAALPLGGNDPIPLPHDLDLLLRGSGVELADADGTPLISADKALEIAGKTLREQLEGNNLPANNPPEPLALVRRTYVPRTPLGHDRPINVWVVAYRWKYDCRNPNGGPGPCPTTEFYFIDDGTGSVVASYGFS